MSFSLRWHRIRTELEAAGFDGSLWFSRENVRYLTGFSGSNGQVWLDAQRVVLLTDGRYRAQAQAEACFDDLIIYERLASAVAGLVNRTGGTFGFEASGVTVQQWARIAENLGGHWQDLGPTADTLRVAKDAQEVAEIRRAIEIAEAALCEVGKRITAGVAERDVALELEWAMRRRGSRCAAFATIVASGTRSALPHGVASDKLLAEGEGLTLDFGAESGGYFSDMTFSGSIGRRNAWHEEIIGILLEAQRAALARIAPGVPVAEADRSARDVIATAGYGDAFTHSLGHGVGLAVHEAPRLSSQSEERFVAGMVVTIEPGIYVPGGGGARIEDMVLVTDQGAQLLTTLPKSAAVWPLQDFREGCQRD